LILYAHIDEIVDFICTYWCE